MKFLKALADAIRNFFVWLSGSIGDTFAALFRPLNNGVVAPSTNPEDEDKAATIAEQQARRQAILDYQGEQDRKKCQAISVRAGVRAALRGQDPIGVEPHISRWMKGLEPDALAVLGRMELQDIIRMLDGDPNQPLGEHFRAKEAAAEKPTTEAVVDRRDEKPTPIEDVRAHMKARAAELTAKRFAARAAAAG